jgi:uncharacterized protein YecE (DUF72 family)
LGKVLLGTCSWTDKSLIESGTFYPAPSLSAEDRLRYYATQFPLVEVDSTYYALPNARTSALWAERTPPGFVFDIKAFRLFTGHWAEKRAFPRDLQDALGDVPERKRGYYYKDVPVEVVDETWRRFVAALEPLRVENKMGLVLLQFPSWVHSSDKTKDHILTAQEKLAGHSLAIEFRHHSWLDDENRADTLAFLRDNGLVFVSVDEPQGFTSSLPPLAEATADLAYVRFHGRNAATWEAPGVTAADRFDWYYSEEEMGEWVPRLQALQAQATSVHALMNTNRGDQGPVNARLLARLLQVPLPDATED